MLIRHATFNVNLPSINSRGLLTSKATGRLKAVWFHASSKTPRACLHIVQRHGGIVQDVAVLEVEIPRSWLKRNRRGLWYCKRDIPASRIRRVIRFAELSASPIGEIEAMLAGLTDLEWAG